MAQAPPRVQQHQNPANSRAAMASFPSRPRTAASESEAVSPPRRIGMQISPRTVRLVQLALVLGVGVIVMLAYLLHPGVRAEMTRAFAVLASGDGTAIGDYLRSFGVWAPVASLGLMLVQAVAAPVPAILVAFANGLAFGVFWGGLLTVTGQTLAAVVCFAIARALGRGPVEALTSRFGLEAADEWSRRWGGRGIFVLRLVPGISFDVVSYAAGLTGIGFAPFVVSTALGVAPQAFLYAWLIREAPQSAWALYAVSWLLIAIFLAGAVFRARRGTASSRRPASTSGRAGPSLASCD